MPRSVYQVFRCDELEFTLNTTGSRASEFATKYPACLGAEPSAVIPVRAGLGSEEEAASALRLSFGASLWTSLMIHAIGVEYYVS